jgi:hypothetical protein
MNTLLPPELWASEIMHSYMKSLWLQSIRREPYPDGIRGTYARELDEAGFNRIVIKPVAKRSQRSRACAGFGWTNMYHGHFSTRDKNYDHVCLICDGKGWRKGINLMDLIHAVK